MLHIIKMLLLPQPSSCFNSPFSALPTEQDTGCFPETGECGGGVLASTESSMPMSGIKPQFLSQLACSTDNYTA